MTAKLFRFLRRTPGLTPEAFAERWASSGRAAVLEAAGATGALRGYVQNAVIATPELPDFPWASFDGVDELWFDSADDLLGVLDAPGWARLGETSSAFADPGQTIAVAAEESIQLDHGWGEVVFIGLSKRAAAFATRADWRRYWIEVHGPLAYGIPEFARHYGRYAHNYVLELEHPRLPRQDDFDGIVQEWLHSAADFARCLQEPEYLRLVQPDEQRFVDFSASRLVMARPTVVLAPQTAG